MDWGEVMQCKAASFKAMKELFPALDQCAFDSAIQPMTDAMERLFKASTDHQKLQADYDHAVEEIRDLKRQLGMNSQNSSKPPSSDGYKKPRNLSNRQSTGKPRGGQKGHTGTTKPTPKPQNVDEIKQHFPATCVGCSHFEECKRSGKFACSGSRYVFAVKCITVVTEHQTMEVVSRCTLGYNRKLLRGKFPQDVKAHVQHDDSLAIIATLLSVHGAVSVERIRQELSDLFDLPTLSRGTVYGMIKRSASLISGVMPVVQGKLQNSEILNCDETGLRVEGATKWVHNSSNGQYTYQTINDKRGADGIKANGVLPTFKGTVVHDCWRSYWKCGARHTHAVCGAHILRDLKGVAENSPKHTWATKAHDLLTEAVKDKKQLIEEGYNTPPWPRLTRFLEDYDKILVLANSECPPPPPPKKGRQKKGKERALIERLEKLKDQVCLFFKDFAVPFDNNQAERDVRPTKTKAKVSGCFRTDEGAQDYLTIASYLSTARKLGFSAYDALTQAYKGNACFIFNDQKSE